MFYKFHIGMVVKNLTTIENMDKKGVLSQKVYDKGLKLNFLQIFGTNPWLWLVPFNGKSGMPCGDGVIWSQEKALQFEEELNGMDENTKSTSRQSRLGNSLGGISASRDIISPKREEEWKRDTEFTLNSFRANLHTSNESNV